MLTSYAQDIGAPVQTTDVTGLHSSGGEFELQLVDDALIARSVVVATGAFQQPLSNAASPTVPAGVVQMHTSAYRNPDQLDGGVLIVGSGQSGCEIGLELLETGRDVHLAVGRWLVPLAIPRPRAHALDGRRRRRRDAGRSRQPGCAGRRKRRLRVGRRPGLQRSCSSGWRASVREVRGLRVRPRATLHTAATSGRAQQASSCRLPFPRPSGRRDHDPTTLALNREGVATVLWPVGSARRSRGSTPRSSTSSPASDMGVSEVPGRVRRLPWLHTRKSPLLLGVGEDAAHVATRSLPTSMAPPVGGANDGRSAYLIVKMPFMPAAAWPGTAEVGIPSELRPSASRTSQARAVLSSCP